MSLAHGRSYLAIPGPSVMPDRVLQAMHRAAPNIYTGELHVLTDSLFPDLKALARSTQHCAMYISNGHGVWEASLTNVLSRGDAVLSLVVGRFGAGWADVAARLGADVEVMDFGMETDVDNARLQARLEADTEHRIKVITTVHVDTSTGVVNDIAAMRAAIDAAGHPALLMVDCIASLGCDRFEFDAWGVDVMLTASQKGLMTPPGMAFVYFSDRAAEARKSAGMVTPYWDWAPRDEAEQFYMNFGGTAPTHHLYGLRTALDMINEEGLEAVWARHETLARAVWAAVEAWGQGGSMRLNIRDAAKRSCAITSVGMASGEADRLRAWCEEKAGLILGIGLGRDDSSAWFRIGHMGHVNANMIMGALGTIEAGLTALQIPHGEGALGAAAAVIAEA
ncbi:pyridoxal-phosphate-dependent aminotransferase family protein [Pseudoroseicyclus aestuarii]|uniref:Alanine-glyoxylate transaminase/serine-glyoxylate transaminase/serine-pyruvate transaminase n=1 Tax=Pseudoroseicyclus aestuarii TaxID=1795041 RepID=A0A318TAW2_9RHOB|nr:aminotransferase class V-fold PLP-dependent enzyme [Pseudoroseicyclus aestuarii]PYE85458.1 alanine-glyoxylate transaminase/serine-glyoxylate transaminase/serine-pyruvate transaminase [Pseudoroseicyclus aestuarii]